MDELKHLPDEALSQIVRTEWRVRSLLPTVDEVEESEDREDIARMILSSRHPLGTTGREGLPDQG